MTDEDRIGDILLKWEDEIGQGRDVAAEDLCHDCPELTGEVADRIESLKRTAWLLKLGQAAEPPLLSAQQAGQVLAGRYRLDKRLGAGGFGEVWAGYDLELLRTVAVKVPKSASPPDPEQVEGFLAEARKVARLKHPGIVPVHDVGRHDGAYFFVCELIDGTDLRQRILTNRPSPQESARIVAEVAEHLDYAHGQGFVHLDVKSANILLDAQGRAFITDFGIAVSHGEQTTTSGLGTLPYMSPEQLMGEDSQIDRRSDIYSLGVVLYELLTGNPPFRGSDPAMVREQILHQEPQPPRSIQRPIPRDIETICLKCLAKSPANRYPDAKSLAAELRKSLTRPGRRLFLTCGIVLLVAVTAGLLAWSRIEPDDLSRDLSGTWSGTWDDRDGTSGDAILNLTEQSGGTLTGWWDKDFAIQKGRRVSRNEIAWEASAKDETYHARGKVRDRGRALLLLYAGKETIGKKTITYIGVERLSRECAAPYSAPRPEGWAGKWLGIYANSLGGVGGDDLTIKEGDDGNLVCTWDAGSTMKGTKDDGHKARWEQVQPVYENRLYKAEVWLEGEIMRTKYTMTYPPGSKQPDFTGEEWFIRD